MDLYFDGPWSIRWDLGLTFVILDEFPNTIVPDADYGVVGGCVDDKGAGNQDEVGGVA